VRQSALMSWTVKLLMVMLVAVGLTACGDDDDDPTEDSATLAAPTETTANSATDAGASGCWTGEQRGEDLNGKPQWNVAPATTIDPEKAYTARFETSMGSFTVELLPKDAPQTVNSFVCLAREGFFDGIVFHRVVAEFVVQAGDPTGTGGGGPGYRFADELPTTLNYERGTLAMANAGPNTNGSQFFVCLADLTQRLPKNYSIFGRVTDGMETVDAIGAVQVEQGRSGEVSSPVEPVTITSVTISEG
jgi:cyclophilin family peptidyl-prolyl cis-trans isomerase